MAILENGTKNYFKINPEQCFVQNNMLFAYITVYGSETDRQNEKRRLDDFAVFDANCKRILEELGTKEQNTELYIAFSKAVESIKGRTYTNGMPTLSGNIFSEEITRLLANCGYRSEWLDQPIRIVSKSLVNCGICEEPLTAEYVYGKLKAKMSQDILNI